MACPPLSTPNAINKRSLLVCCWQHLVMVDVASCQQLTNNRRLLIPLSIQFCIQYDGRLGMTKSIMQVHLRQPRLVSAWCKITNNILDHIHSSNWSCASFSLITVTKLTVYYFVYDRQTKCHVCHSDTVNSWSRVRWNTPLEASCAPRTSVRSNPNPKTWP